MAGLKINKKVVKDTKIDENIEATSNEGSRGGNSSREDNSVENPDLEFGDITSSVDEILEDTDGEDDNEGNNSKSKIKLIAIGGVLLIVIAVGVVMVISKKGVEDVDMLPPGDAVINDVVNTPTVEEVKEEEVEETPSEPVDDVKKEDKVVYENALLGLALKYPSDWYVEERADVLLNMVQSTSLNGNLDLLVNEVKLAGVVMDFSARDELGTKVSLGVSPLVITGDTQVADITSLSDILNIGTAGQIDQQIKTNIEANGGTVLENTPSVVKDIGAYKVIQSAYKFDKNGIKMDVIQMLVPYGVNNIVLTCTSKDGDNPINKEEILVQMLGSLGKVGEVSLNEIVDEEVNTPVDDANNAVTNVDKAVSNLGEANKEEGAKN